MGLVQVEPFSGTRNRNPMSEIEEVKQRADIIEIVSRYTPLKRAGATYKGLCPFHTERTPSFVVFPQTGTWRCFGACGTGGDVFSFLMQRENLDFREALKLLAQETGVELDPQQSDDPERRLRAKIHEINRLAALYFAQILWEHPAAEDARAYLERRLIDRQTAEQFQLGYALDEWSGLLDALRAQNFSAEDLQSAGVVKRHETRGSVYDAFRGRVMIPIMDRRKQVVGFGGRVLGDGQPKYLNTAETAVFHKSKIVYGLDRAGRAISDAERVVIVEGYMDVIAAHQHGFENVVACLGTAVTSDQLRQLQRYTENFVLALDADAAGRQATLRGINQARSALARIQKPRLMATGRVRIEQRFGANLFVTALPAGKDPDDIIRNAPAEWEALVEEADPLVDFVFDLVAEQYDLNSASGKASAVSELAPLIAELADEIERQHYVNRLSRLVAVDERTIEGRVLYAAKALQAQPKPATRSQAERLRPRAIGAAALASPAASGAMPPAEDGAGEAILPLPGAPLPLRATDQLHREDHLLAAVLQAPELLVWLAATTQKLEIPPFRSQDLRHTENQEILRTLKRYLSGDEPWDLDQFQADLTEHLHGRLARLVDYGLGLPDIANAVLREDVIKTLVTLRQQQLKEEIGRLGHLIAEARQSNEQHSALMYMSSETRCRHELYHLQVEVNRRLPKVLSGRTESDNAIRIR